MWFHELRRMAVQKLIPVVAAVWGSILGGGILMADDGPTSAERPVIVVDADGRQKMRTLAFEAARRGDVETLDEYFSAGQEPKITTRRGDTLLILAGYYGQESAVTRILKEPGVKIDAVNGMGFTALTGACFKGHVKLVERLMKHGAEVNTRNGVGQTPLMFAALFDRKEIVRLLIRAGADVDFADKVGRTASSLASQQGNDAMVALIREEAARRKRLQAEDSKGVSTTNENGRPTKKADMIQEK